MRWTLRALLTLTLAALSCDARAPLPLGLDGSTGAMSCTGTPMTVRGKVGGGSVGSEAVDCAGADKVFTWKGGAPGAPCGSGLDCTPTCCACALGPGGNALTSWCLDGQCVAPQEACCILAGTPTMSCGAQ